jgi:hypothetical protein
MRKLLEEQTISRHFIPHSRYIIINSTRVLENKLDIGKIETNLLLEFVDEKLPSINGCHQAGWVLSEMSFVEDVVVGMCWSA